MKCFVIPSLVVEPQVLPEQGVSFHRAKCDTAVPGLVAVDDITPALVCWRTQQWEVCSPACGVVADVNVGKEARHPIAPVGRNGVGRIGKPVGVEVVFLPRGVLHELQWLEMGWWDIVTLEIKRTLLDALDNAVALHVG